MVIFWGFRWSKINDTYLDIVDVHHSIAGVHILLHVSLHKLKDESEGVVGVDDVVKSDDIGVFQIFQEWDLSDGCAGSAFFML